MLKAAIIGTGFWSQYQLAAWKEIPGVQIVAAYNRTKEKAVAIANKFGIPTVYDDAAEMFQQEELDFVDIITDVDTHFKFVQLAAKKGIDVVCQKPMATSLEQATAMVELCTQNKVKFFIHENFRWQAPMRALKAKLDLGVIVKPFKARVSFCSAFPVFDNQPFLATLDKFIVTDIGSHVLDICRFLFGETEKLHCNTQRVNSSIRGEDVANVFLQMKNGMDCFVEMSYASILEKESFPQTLVLIEGSEGSLQLGNDCVLSTTTRSGTERENIQPPFYSWADPAYAVVHSSIVECNRNILQGLNGGICETTGSDNLKTAALVWGSYESAIRKQVLPPAYA